MLEKTESPDGGPATDHVRVKQSEDINVESEIMDRKVDNSNAYIAGLLKKIKRAECWALVCLSLLTLFLTAFVITFQILREEHGWFVSRSEWQSDPTIDLSTVGFMREPSPLVIISHSATATCDTLEECSALMRLMQSIYKNVMDWTDVPYNFAIGSDGRVYEGRGWAYLGAHSGQYDSCALGIAFLGDYRTATMRGANATAMVENMHRILEVGVELGHLRSDYVVVAHRDVHAAGLNPGDSLYELVREWPQYDAARYAGRTCDQIWPANVISIVPPIISIGGN